MPNPQVAFFEKVLEAAGILRLDRLISLVEWECRQLVNTTTVSECGVIADEIASLRRIVRRASKSTTKTVAWSGHTCRSVVLSADRLEALLRCFCTVHDVHEAGTVSVSPCVGTCGTTPLSICRLPILATDSTRSFCWSFVDRSQTV